MINLDPPFLIQIEKKRLIECPTGFTEIVIFEFRR